MGERYFERFTAAEIARHLQGLDGLTPDHPVEVWVDPHSEGRLTCTFLAFDYPGLFSLFTGLLSGAGFNIQSGDIFTSAREPASLENHAHQARQVLVRRSMGLPTAVAPERRRYVIDRFEGLIDPDVSPGDWEGMVRNRVAEIVSLLERKAADQARDRVNIWVTQALEAVQGQQPPALMPMDLKLDNESGAFTRLTVVSQDTPAFLYALSNALSLGGVSIERVTIRTTGGRVEDEIDFSTLGGDRITDPDTLRHIQWSVLLTKQFTHFLPKAPDPYAALTRFNSLLLDVMSLPERGQWIERFSQARNLDGLARVLGASDFIWEDFIRLQHEALAPMLESQSTRLFDRETLSQRLNAALDAAGSLAEKIDRLNAFKDHEIFLIDLDHILGGKTYDPRTLAENLTLLAQQVVEAAYRLAFAALAERHGRPRTVGGLEARCAVMGLGKMGGAALGYASDIELMFVYSDVGQTDGPQPIENTLFFEYLVQEFRNCIRAKREGIFELDFQLRPYGGDGPLACSLEAFCRYFGPGGPAHSYERLALVRMRAVAGDPDLGAQVERLRDEFVYATRNIDILQLRDLRNRQYEEKTAGRPNAKFSPGALVDLEYDVQILQVMYAHRVPGLKTPYIHKALEALLAAGMLSELEKERLVNAYYFLRQLINGLRMLRGNARDLFLPPPDTPEFYHLARRMGYERRGDLNRSRQLYLDFETHTAAVRAFVERHFGRDSLPGPVMGNAADLVLSDRAPQPLVERILEAIGLQDVTRALRNLRGLAGEGRRRDRFAMLAVLACDMLKTKADPDMALNNWERFVAALPDPVQHFETLLSQPRRLDILLTIFATSQFLSDALVIDPDFFDWATSPENIHRPLQRAKVEEDLRALSRAAAGAEAWRRAIRRYRRREILRIGARDICFGAPIPQIIRDLSTLAEGMIQVAFERFWEESGAGAAGLSGRMCILAFGKLGAGELNYSSDIDLLGVYDGDAAPEFADAMERVREDLSVHTDEGYAYRVDLRLRPYGRSGPLVPSVASATDYYQTRASLWEAQALLKLRPVAGAMEIGEEMLRRLRPVLCQARDPKKIVQSIESMRVGAIAKSGGAARPLLRALSPSAPTEAHNVKEGRGGIRDIEFLVQGLQLMGASRDERLIESSTLGALKVLETTGALPTQTARQLREYYIFLRRAEHYLQIMEDRQTHALPTNPTELRAFARRILAGKASEEIFLTCLGECRRRVHALYRDWLVARSEGR